MTQCHWACRNRQITAAQRAAFRADLRYWHTAIVVLSPYAPHYDELRYVLSQLTRRDTPDNTGKTPDQKAQRLNGKLGACLETQ
jgi:hypothetical protein